MCESTSILEENSIQKIHTFFEKPASEQESRELDSIARILQDDRSKLLQ